MDIRKILFYRKEILCYLISHKNKRIFEILKEQRVHNYIEKKFINKYTFTEIQDKLKISKSNDVWIYWYQGIDQAPKIVKYCIERTKKLFENNKYQVHLIDKYNINSYITLPKHIIDKFNKRIIGQAHFSDLVRLELLDKYGGIWIDSTVLFTDIDKGIPEFLKNDFFVFRNFDINNEYINISNWLIKSYKDNPLIKDTKNILYKYWKTENYAKQYYIFHIIFKMVTEKHKKLWDSYNYKFNYYPHLLQSELNKEYNYKNINNIIIKTQIHKLIYKNIDYENKNNVLNYILNDKII